MTANVCGLKLVQGVERSDRLLDTIILSANLLNQEIGVEIRNRGGIGRKNRNDQKQSSAEEES